MSSLALLALGVALVSPVLIAETSKAQTVLLDDLNPVFHALLDEVPALGDLVRVGVAVRAVFLGDLSPPVATLTRCLAITLLVGLGVFTATLGLVLVATLVGGL